MNCFMRPYIQIGMTAVLAAVVAMTPPSASAQLSRITQIIDAPNPLLLHSGAQGYLGVLVGDVDNDSAPKLRLKELRGAVITLIDHDAPAAQAGLRVNDVVLEMNGQQVEGAEQFGRMMHEVPPGHKVTMVVSRDGVNQTITVQLVDRKKMENDVWNKLGSGSDTFTPTPGMGILGGGGAGDAPLPGGFHMPFFGSSLNVGALVEPLTSQMAEYLGVASGLMVKQVVRKSEAAAAGLKAFDVIIKVGAEGIATSADWDRALRANQGKPVQVTILRDKKQQTLTMQVDSKRRGELEFEEIFPNGSCPMMAIADPEVAQDLAQHFVFDESAAESMRQQAEALKDQFQNFNVESGFTPFMIGPEQAEEFRKQAEELRDQLKGQNFQNFNIDSKQLEEMKKQLDEMRKNFKFEDFKIDPKQMEQFHKQMEQFRLQMNDIQTFNFGKLV
jgi:serine protease Do